MPTKQINKPTSSNSKNKSKPMAKQTSELITEVLEAIDTATGKKQPIGKEASVVKEGNKIIIPEGMSYDNAITWIQRKKESEEKVVAIYDTIPCYPLDGSVAVMNAIKDIYGFTGLSDTPGFFGSNPPLLVQVPLADGTFETALIGRIAIPKWEGGYIDLTVGRDANIVLNGQIKKKFEPELKAVVARARERLAASSIYKGQAIRIDLGFMHGDHDFHPINDAPKFFDIENVDELILNEVTEMELQDSVYLRIEHTAYCEANNISLKHGCLLMGSFGTGKTLCARNLARKCVDNGWNFVYLTNPAHLAKMLMLAKLWGKTLIFSEDVDQAVTGGRTEAVNNIMNTIDGVDTKGCPIITVLTTNNPLDIEQGFLRAGRIDTTILFELPDAPTAIRFVQKLSVDDDGHSLLEPGTELAPVGEAMAGFVPAFITEAVQKAKCHAIVRQLKVAGEGEEVVIRGKVTGNDLILAAKALKKHIDMVNRPTDKTPAEKLHDAVELMGSTINGQVMVNVNNVRRQIENL